MLLADHLAERLRRETSAEVLFTRADRGRYATDASIYQVMPIGVVVPRSTDDVVAAMAVARAEGVPVLARGGGTSQCGQTVNRALVIDFSKHLNRVLHVDPAARTARVEPGIVLGTLNAALASAQLFFPVDPSTHSRCTIGGMAGNNSCGAKSIRYGLMADNVRAIEALLADGTQHRFSIGQNEAAPRITELTARLLALGEAEATEIAARFPQVLRRVGGYNIDTLVPGRRPLNLARLLVGSEGTLALSTAIELFLHPIRPRKVVGICQFPTFRAAMAGDEASGDTRPRGGGAGRSHDDRAGARHSRSIAPTIDGDADRRAGKPAHRRIPRRRGCDAARRGSTRWIRRWAISAIPARSCARPTPRSRRASRRCARPASTS